jgi:hypothetical protein
MKYEEDHDYPFAGTKHLDPIGINVDPVQMRSKMVADFDKIDKLKDPEAKPPLSLT